MTTINSVGNGLTSATGTGNFVGSTSPTIVTPTLTTSMTVASGFYVLGTSGTKVAEFLSQSGSAVNWVYIESANTGVAPVVSAAGTDTNVTLSVSGQGTGGVQVQGTTSGINPPSGFFGHLIQSNIPYASAISTTINTVKQLTSITLPAGNWEITGNACLTLSSPYQGGQFTTSINTSSSAQADISYTSSVQSTSTTYGALCLVAPSWFVSITTPTTYYLVFGAVFTAGTATVCGNLVGKIIS